ncbi:MAG: AraC family transcriptional regulator [Prolixibacteraceae bacterium]
MENKLRYYLLPLPVTAQQGQNRVTGDLYLTETGEVEIKPGTIWSSGGKLYNNLLVFCTRGSGIVIISGEQIPVTSYQFFIIPKGDEFKFYAEMDEPVRLLLAYFGGKKAGMLGDRFSVVRSLIPSVNNLVANREMLFEEIFNNLAKGFYNQNLEYVNFCFGHLLATFIYAHKTSDDLADESSPAVRRSIDFMNKNLGKKLTLQKISEEAGYSPTYFTTLFRKETNYSPLSYFAHLKIVKACEFLDYTRLKIKEISYHLGYSDPYYFTKDFKKKMGISPRQYRNRMGKD